MAKQGIDEAEKLKLKFKMLNEFIQGLKDSKKENSDIPSDIKEEINMKGITMRKDGRYQIQLQKNGIRTIKYASTLEKAKKELSKLKKTNPQSKEIKQIEKKYTIGEWYTKWINEYKKPFVSSDSLADIKCSLNSFIAKLKNIELKELKTEQIQNILNKIPQNRTKQKIWINFNALLEKACDLNIISYNPFKAVVKDKKIIYKSSSYNYDEQEIIISNAKNYNIEEEILIYLLTGCRPNELPCKANFDFQNNIVNIYGTKNENAKHRQVEMTQCFSDYIKKYFEKNDIKSHEYIKKQFKQLCIDNKIENPKLYRLRHTFATNHFTLGTNAKYVQHWLGHYGIQLTLDTYTDIDKKSSKDKIRKLYNNFYYEF